MVDMHLIFLELDMKGIGCGGYREFPRVENFQNPHINRGTGIREARMNVEKCLLKDEDCNTE